MCCQPLFGSTLLTSLSMSKGGMVDLQTAYEILIEQGNSAEALHARLIFVLGGKLLEDTNEEKSTYLTHNYLVNSHLHFVYEYARFKRQENKGNRNSRLPSS
jgi:hypothetical protein